MEKSRGQVLEPAPATELKGRGFALTPALEALNALSPADAQSRFFSCCGSSEWARRMAAARPFRTAESVAETADRTWRGLSKDDWLEAFSAHPPIGVAGTGFILHPPPNSSVPPDSDRANAWARQEQSGTRGGEVGQLRELALLNRQYAERFGHVFLICATGKSAGEILALGRQRLPNDPETELAIAAEEQRKITRLRLEKLLSPTEP